MTVEISDEAYSILQEQVANGRYPTNTAALEAMIQEHAEEPDEEYTAYVRQAVEEGLADVAAGRTVPAETVLAGLRARLTR